MGLLRSAFNLTDTYWAGTLGAAQLSALMHNAFALWIIQLACTVVATGLQARVSSLVGAGDDAAVSRAVVQGLWGAAATYLLLLLVSPFVPALYASGIGIEPGTRRARTAPLAPPHSPRWLSRRSRRQRPRSRLSRTRKNTSRPPRHDRIRRARRRPGPRADVRLGSLPSPRRRGRRRGCLCRLCLRRRVTRARVAAIVRRLARMGAAESVRDCRNGSRGTPARVQRGGVHARVHRNRSRGVWVRGAKPRRARLGAKFEAVAFTVIEGFRLACATLVGQWVGAGKPRRARNAAAVSVALCVAAMAPFVAALFSLGPTLAGSVGADPATAAAAGSYLRWNSGALLFLALEAVTEGAFTGAGNTVPVLVVGTLCNLARVPAAHYLAFAAGWGVEGVWAAIVASQILKGLLKSWWFRTRVMTDLERKAGGGENDEDEGWKRGFLGLAW